MLRALDREELPIDTAQLARFLIGKMLVRMLAEGVAAGRIVETEAYEIGDPAGHAYRGITPRNRALFLERGHAYVYLAYGSSFLLNVSSETSGVGAGVLIRAIEPTDGIMIMERNRGTKRVRDLARGPGRLSGAFGIDRRLDGIDLCRTGPLWLGSDGQAPGEIGQSKRIGITRAVDNPLRFYVRGNWFVVSGLPWPWGWRLDGQVAFGVAQHQGMSSSMRDWRQPLTRRVSRSVR